MYRSHDPMIVTVHNVQITIDVKHDACRSAEYETIWDSITCHCHSAQLTWIKKLNSVVVRISHVQGEFDIDKNSMRMIEHIRHRPRTARTSHRDRHGRIAVDLHPEDAMAIRRRAVQTIIDVDKESSA